MNNQEYDNAPPHIAIHQFEATAVNFGYRFIHDAPVRAEYIKLTKKMSEEIKAAYLRGDLSPKDAAKAAHGMRNQIMEAARAKSSDLGRAYAVLMKNKGIDFDSLTRTYAKRLYGKQFSELSGVEKNRVFLEMVDRSGAPRTGTNRLARGLGTTGRALWVLTAVVAIYNVSASENKVKTAGREVSNIGGGVAGWVATGAVVGIWAGPVGIAIGGIIGGILGAIIADQVYVHVTGVDGEFARSFIPRFTTIFGMNEEAMAEALVRECSFEAHKVLEVFRELDDKYSTDADDVALLYVNKVKQLPEGNPTKILLEKDARLRDCLRSILASGWTSHEEERAIAYLDDLDTHEGIPVKNPIKSRTSINFNTISTNMLRGH